MTKEVEERVKIFQQAMVACHSSNPTDCIEWLADRIVEFEKKNTKAKELLKKWVELSKPKLEGYPIPPIQEQTEQFISEVEK